MPGVSFVTDEYYRGHLEALRVGVAALERGEDAPRVSFHARVLMRSDAAGVSDAERAEAEVLIDRSAGILARRHRPQRCYYCRTGIGAACNCI